jgi:hypothetical protein
MFCQCRHNPDITLRQLERGYLRDPNNQELQDRFLHASLRAGHIPVSIFVLAVRQLEIQAKNVIFQQLEQDPSYRRGPDARPQFYMERRMDSVEVRCRLFVGSPQQFRRVEYYAIGESHFHLSPCGGCGLLAWGQPCVYCEYYPRGRYSREITRRTRQDFLNRLQRFPSFFHFYAIMHAENRVPEWAPIAHRIRDEMLALGGQYTWPTHEEIWDYFTRLHSNT